MLIAVSPEWHEKTGLSSKELSRRIGEAIFPTKTGFGFPKVLVVEDDFDFTDVGQVVWAFATRAHPHNGEVYFENRAQNNLPVFLERDEKSNYQTTKVVHNCLLADRFPKHERPVAADIPNGWPLEIQRRVLDGWRSYGYRTE
jgi:4-hydroxy-3-polyprenylbenzoate decarboxylase